MLGRASLKKNQLTTISSRIGPTNTIIFDDGMNYTPGGTQVVQICAEAASVIAIPFVITACIHRVYSREPSGMRLVCITNGNL